MNVFDDWYEIHSLIVYKCLRNLKIGASPYLLK